MCGIKKGWKEIAREIKQAKPRSIAMCLGGQSTAGKHARAQGGQLEPCQLPLRIEISYHSNLFTIKPGMAAHF